jgi:branched-chain amino acid transport system ATP-binding protein
MTILEVSELSARYGDSAVLHDVSFTVEEGDFFGILGANGAGKTTILRSIEGLRPPAVRGSITYAGRDLLALPSHRRASVGIGVVPEGRRMFSSLSVRDNLLMGAYHRGKASQARMMGEVLETFPELADRLSQPAGSLSGGQQQMVAFGRALMSEPRLLMMDEPSLGLAPVVVQRIFELLASMHKRGDLTMILVEQNALEAFPLLTRGCVVQRGRIVFIGTKAELESTSAVTEAYFGAE